MKKTSSFNKIIHNRSLPPHIVDINGNPLNVEEIRVRFICEKIFETKILNGDRPDLYAENQEFGIEVTSAKNISCKLHGASNIKRQKLINYCEFNGRRDKDMYKNGINYESLQSISMSANADIYIKEIMRMLTEKLDKLNEKNGEPYAEYPESYLYIASIADTLSLSINDMVKLLYDIDEVQQKYKKTYKIVLLECTDCFVKFDYHIGCAYFMPEIFKLIPNLTHQARKYVEAKHSGGKAPDSPAESMIKIYNAIEISDI